MERVIKFGYLPPDNWFNFLKNEFLCLESFFVKFSNLQAEENCFIFKLLGRLDEKRAAVSPVIVNFATI